MEPTLYFSFIYSFHYVLWNRSYIFLSNSVHVCIRLFYHRSFIYAIYTKRDIYAKRDGKKDRNTKKEPDT